MIRLAIEEAVMIRLAIEEAVAGVELIKLKARLAAAQSYSMNPSMGIESDLLRYEIDALEKFVETGER